MPRILLFLASCILLSIPTFFYNKETTHKVNFKITNIKNAQKGNFVLCFFANQEEFDKEKESLRFEIEKTKIVNKEIFFSLDIPSGKYGCIVLDDENLNDAMDFSLFLPKEGFGFSNFYPLFRPKFKNFSFTVPYNEDNPVEIKLRYFL